MGMIDPSADATSQDSGASRRDAPLVGGPSAPVVLRHLVLTGSDRAIGRRLGELAIERYGLEAQELLTDARYARARRGYFKRLYPAHSRRTRGVASALAVNPDDDRFDLSILPLGHGASRRGAFLGHATYAPGWTTGDGLALLTRSAWATEAPVELYAMQWSRSSGLGSIALHALDLLSGTIVGVNAAGVAVAAVAVESATRADPTLPLRAVGCHELQLMRLVLDTCTTVDEAQAALLATCACRLFGRARYLIADMAGRSFVYEPESPSFQRLLDGDGERQDIDSHRSEGGHEPASIAWQAVVDQKARSLGIRMPALDAVAGDRPESGYGPKDFVFTLVHASTRQRAGANRLPE